MRKYRDKNIPKSIQLFYKYSVFVFINLLIYRIIFFIWSFPAIDQSNKQFIGQSLLIGLRFDLRLVGLLFIPLFIALSIPVWEPLKRKWGRRVFIWLQALLYLIVHVIYLSDFGYYAKSLNRINSTSLAALSRPLDLFKFWWANYPVLWASCLLLILMFMHYHFLKYIIVNYVLQIEIKSTFAVILTRLFIFTCMVIMLYGKVSYYPLRWSEAYFTPNHFVSQFSLNPVINILDSMSFTQKSFDSASLKQHIAILAQEYGQKWTSEEDLLREYPERAPRKILNIVVVMLESLALNKTSLSGNPIDPTPNLKKLAQESWVFPNSYTPADSSARGVFAAVTGNADVSLDKSSSRNPFIVNQHSIINSLRDHEKFYFLGGSANWGNIRGIWTNNVSGVHIYEEGSYEAESVDVWGISDLDLFREAKKVMDNQTRSFFSFIQTSGFHRPYTIPKKNYGFIKNDKTQEEVMKYGFSSLQEYHSMRLQDHALGLFVDSLKGSTYYKDTLLIIYGDHGVPSGESLHTPKGVIEHNLLLHQVPMLFHHANILPAKTEKKVVSTLDALPTALSYLGHPFQIRTLGRDLYRNRTPSQNNFLFNWNGGAPRYGIINERFYFTTHAGVDALYEYLSNEENVNVAEKYPVEFVRMKKLNQAFFEISTYLLYHNLKM